MCGFSGYIDFDRPRFAKFFWSDELILKHRGPDFYGKFMNESNRVGLMHFRLSILDPSPRSNQPFHSGNKRYVMAYNGEVYNFRELAKELKIKQKTGSDTEVIIEAFGLLGPDFVKKLNGMFCMAIYDREKNEMFLFRDRLGVKPLYFFYDRDGLLFGSELKSMVPSLQKTGNADLDHNAIANYLHLGYIPEHQSIFKQVRKFPAGHYARITPAGIQFTRYWDVEDHLRQITQKDRVKTQEHLRKMIEQSVERRLISDVPLGTFLSGGIDSSLVTAIARNHSTAKINSFSIGFREEKYNEAAHASEISRFLGTNHHEKILTYDDAKERVAQLIDVYDEPYADSSAIPTMLLSEFARTHVKVALSGDGGDELFMGYGMYNWALRLNNPLIRYLRRPLGRFMKMMPDQRIQRAGMVFDFEQWSSWQTHLFSQEQYFFSEPEIGKILKTEYYIDSFRTTGIIQRKLKPHEKQSIFDIRYYLRDDLLTKIDRASMRYGLEVRVPLLDHLIVEFALNIDPKLKLNGKNRKIILQKILYHYIPKSYFNRPKKGFSIPLSEWLSKDLKFLIDTYLSRAVIEQFNICNYEVVQQLIKKYLGGRKFLYNRVWALIILHQWLVRNNP